MRFATFVAPGLFAALAVAAQTSTVSIDPAQASQAACLKKCDAGDVDCQAHCISVPSPNQSQANATNECVAKCPQGNGSAAQTNAYKNCIDQCVAQNFFVTSEGTPEATGAPGNSNSNGNGNSGSVSSSAAAPTGSGSGSGSGSDSSSSSGFGSGSASQTGTGSFSPNRTGSAAASTSTNAAPAFIASGALAGVFAAIMAL